MLKKRYLGILLVLELLTDDGRGRPSLLARRFRGLESRREERVMAAGGQPRRRRRHKRNVVRRQDDARHRAHKQLKRKHYDVIHCIRHKWRTCTN